MNLTGRKDEILNISHILFTPEKSLFEMISRFRKRNLDEDLEEDLENYVKRSLRRFL